MIRSHILSVAVVGLASFYPFLLEASADGYDGEEEVFLYSPGEKEGMHIAFGDSIEEVGKIFESDYSQWGSQKRMYSPYVVRLGGGSYAAVFQVNTSSPCFAVTYSEDLITWRPQDYPRVSSRSCIAPVIKKEEDGGTYTILYKDENGKVRETRTDSLFRHFSPDVEGTEEEYEILAQSRDTMTVGDKEYVGNRFMVSRERVADIKEYFDEQARLSELWKESLADDGERFGSLSGRGSLNASLHICDKSRKPISDMLIGIFFEDINFAADGGLYAELIQNRDFEYTPQDHKGWGSTTCWTLGEGEEGEVEIGTDNPLSPTNPHYAILESGKISNSGWDGIALKGGEGYDFSLFANNIDGKDKTLRISLATDGKVLASTKIKTKAQGGWTKYEATLSPVMDADGAILSIEPEGKGRVALDLISLFPQNTFKGRKNGLRKDIAEALANLKPKFVRFPGGCMSHGQGLDNIYHWYHSIGELQDRVPDFNIWHCHQTRGLGFFEYFQFCEDIGAEPLPVLASGVPCQNSAPDKDGYGGQQGGIPMDSMEAYIDELLHLIEWANGDPETSEWARKRAEAGHPDPFDLKYIGIGNEDIISTTFEDRNLIICEAIHRKYPDIKIVGTVGPFHYPSSDYIEGWKFANEHRDLFYMVDEHYYESVGWFINNQDYYDGYDRSAPKVYLGEYAAKSKRGDLDCALAEALYLCGVERNADVVEMTSYAPLLCNDKHHNWDPDMIYFGHSNVDLTPSYETQRLFSHYSGDEYVESTLRLAQTTEDSLMVAKRVSASVVRDSGTGKWYLKIVNVLPVSLNLSIETDVLDLATGLQYEGFSGKPGQRRVTVKKGVCGELGDGKLIISIEPYSFRVVEL